MSWINLIKSALEESILKALIWVGMSLERRSFIRLELSSDTANWINLDLSMIDLLFMILLLRESMKNRTPFGMRLIIIN